MENRLHLMWELSQDSHDGQDPFAGGDLWVEKWMMATEGR